MKNKRFALLSALLITAATPLLAQGSGTAATQRPSAASRFAPWGVDLSARDPAIKPGDDFWRYANNRWFAANPIPADRQAYGVGTVLSEDVEAQLRAIVQEADRGNDPVSRQVAAMYASWMDEAGIEARGAGALRPWLDRINAAQSRDDLIRLFAMPGYPSPVGVGITPDTRDPTRYVAGAAQAGLGMPNRTYYLNEGETFDRYRAAYRVYVATMLRLAGIADHEAKADRIIALERRIAEAHWTPEQSRDLSRSLNPMTPAQLQELAPQFNWPLLLSSQGLGNVQTVIVRQTTAIQGEGRLFGEVDLQTWKDWLSYRFISQNAQFLPRAFDEASFEFYSRTLAGTQQQRDRWKRGLGVLNGTLGEAVGEIYVRRHFPESSRRQMGELITDLRAALEERLRANIWMDDATRAQALEKLAAFDPRIGNPVRFIDYSAMRVDRNDLLGNAMRAAEFQRNLALSRFPNPVDRSLWVMTPQTINAYYSPQTNQITFPAAILQPPFFNPTADAAVNYGAIGAVIGHEIGHGFDDNGRRFDAQGRFRDWWTAQSAERFTELTRRLGAQYSAYRVGRPEHQRRAHHG